jgi:hypothetical protein
MLGVIAYAPRTHDLLSLPRAPIYPHRSLLDPTLTILLPADKVPPFRFKAGGWELLQSSIEVGRR